MTTRSTTERGYGNMHAKLRRQLAPIVARGDAYCMEPVCLMVTRHIPAGTPWDLAHNRETGGYRGPAHQRCNRSEGAHHLNGFKRRRRWTSRAW
jgi:hypothetical protein